MADDDAPHDWDPEKERKQTDPEALARSFVRAAADEQKKIEMESAAECHRPPMRIYTPPLDLQMGVHKIKNGIVITYGQGPHGHPLTVDFAMSEYAKDPEAALAIVQRVTQEFFLGSLAAPGGLPPDAFGLGGLAEPPPMPRRPGDPG